MKELEEVNNTLFESIKYIDEEGCEYWLARELQNALKYKEWRKFNGVIEKAKIACENSNVDTNRQFVQSDKLSINVNGGKRKILDYKLSRYACYLIAQNGDSRKKVIALAQTYFNEILCYDIFLRQINTLLKKHLENAMKLQGNLIIFLRHFLRHLLWLDIIKL